MITEKKKNYYFLNKIFGYQIVTPVGLKTDGQRQNVEGPHAEEEADDVDGH